MFSHRHSLGVRARLVILTLATMLPLVLLAGFGIVNAVDNQGAQVRRTVIQRTEALLAAVDDEINDAQAVLRVLALSPSLQSGDLEAFDKHMRAALDPTSELAIVLHDDAAQQLVSTNRPFGTPLPRQPASEMLDRVVATGKPQVSDLIIGAVLRRPIVTVGVPVFREGRVFYVLAMALAPTRLSTVLQRQAQPPEWTVAIFDRKGNTVARNKELERFLGVAAAPILLDHMNRHDADDWFPNVTKDGAEVYSTFRRSAVTGWVVAIGVPREAVDAPLRTAQFTAFGGGAAVVVLSLVLAWWLGRAIRRPVAALMISARALGAGSRPDVRIRGVRELEEVGEALRISADDIVMAREVLTRSRDELTTAVAERTRELAEANAHLTEEIHAREETQAALIQSQKMEAVGQLTGGIAHDFNNLLTVILGNLRLLERNLPLAEARLRRYAQAAGRGAERAATLTHRLLAFARQQPLAPRSIDLNRLVTGTSELLRRTLGENIALETVLAGGLWPTRADPNELENALLNLVLNARDAMQGIGRLTIETANMHLDENYAAGHDEVSPGQYVMLAITDTGRGMTEEVRAAAFEPFFTTKGESGGSGLGLSMVYGFVKQSSGHISIYSELGHGTTIKLYLPRLTTPEAEVFPELTAPRTPHAAMHECILVVEDEADVRDYSAGLLEELGYEVVAVADAAAALRVLESQSVDLLFADVGLPGLNGRELADRARQSHPDLAVLLTTGYAKNAIVHNGVLDSDVELISKPFSPDALAHNIRRILDAHHDRPSEA
jgi:signal transduction histidine kinase/ActR/RegA family two-component response regulator